MIALQPRLADLSRARSLPHQTCIRDSVYGGERELLRGPGSLFGLADRFLKEPQRAPRMYMACGTEDFLFDANEHFFARFGKELPIEYHTEPGNHTWDFWDRYIERILAWLPLDQAEGV